MQDNGHNRPEETGGGSRYATALFVVLLIAASAVCTRIFLSPRDSLARFVPGNTPFYAHYRIVPGSDSADLQRAFRIPDGLHPKEAAAFAQKNADGELEWSILLSWDSAEGVSSGERALLGNATARELESGTYLIGNARTPANDGSSLAAQEAAPLAALRGLASAQVIFDAGLIDPVAADAARNTYGAAVSIGSGEISATIIPAFALNELLPFVGYRLMPPENEGPAHQATAATVSLSQVSTSFDPVALLFPDIFRIAARKGTPRSRALESAHDRLERLLAGPSTLDIIPDASLTGGQGFVLSYPGMDRNALAAVITEFLGTAIPDTRIFQAPDMDDIHEYIASEDSPFITEKDGSLTLDVPGLAPLNLTTADGASIISSSTKVRDKALAPTPALEPACGRADGAATLTIRSPLTVLGQTQRIGTLLRPLMPSYLVVRSFGDNSLNLCGLIGANVDK